MTSLLLFCLAFALVILPEKHTETLKLTTWKDSFHLNKNVWSC